MNDASDVRLGHTLALRVAIVGLAACGLLACSRGLPEPREQEWRSQLEQLASDGTGIYAWRFYGEDPAPAAYTATIQLSDSAEACSLQSGASALDDADFWSLVINLGDEAEGSYEVSTYGDLEPPSMKVRAELVHRTPGGISESYPAIRGQVRLREPPTYAAFQEGAKLELSARLEWPENPRTRVSCAGGMSASASAPEDARCMCRGHDGEQSTCVPEDLYDDCCTRLAPGEDKVAITTMLKAEPCRGLCRYIGVVDQCAEKLGP